MGFEGLLYMADMSLPRNLCYWLFTRVDPISKIFIAPDGKEFTITPNQVGWVLGLTRGKMAVPHILRGSAMRSIAREVEEKYVVDIECIVKKTGKTIRSSCIPVTNHMLRRLEGHWEDSEKNEFKLLFLVLALNYILRPTLNGKMTYNMLVPLTCYRKAYLYDWADFVLDGLFKSVYAFSRQFYRKGYASGCAGCAIFLSIFYLDRLDRPPVSWGVWPRIKAWNMTEISNARRSDRENGKGDYGKLGCIDLVYGEDHPKSRNDPAAPTPGCIDDSSHDEGEGQCDSGYESPMPAETKVMKKSLTNQRCRKPVKKVVNERACSGSEFNVVEDSAKGETVPKVNGDSLSFPPELFRANVQVHCFDSPNNYKRYNNQFVVENSSFLFVSDDELQKEQSPLVGGVSNPMGSNDCSEACAAVDVDYYDLLCGANSIVVPEECGSRKLSLQLLHSVVTEAEERAKLQLVRFVREKCRLRTCYSVIHGRRGICDEYVRVVGALLNRMWMRNYLYSCIRYFIDPIFAMRVLQNSGASVCRSVAKTLKQRLFALPEHGVEADVSNISEVFIPVLEPLEGKQSGNHWWAVAVSLGKEKVYVIDSNTHYGYEDHLNEVDLILKALG